MVACGASEVVITPILGSPMPGSVRDRGATGTKDDLYAKALVLETEGATVAFVALDVIDVPRRLVERARKRIFEATGIPEEHVMISATHTHTGGPTIRTSYVSAVDERYVDDLTDKAADAAILAFGRRTEARIGFGSGQEADIAFNRRFRMRDGSVRMNPGVRNPDIVEPVGGIDPEVLVVRIDDAAGQPICVVTNYSCHACVVGGTEYSADYPGELSRTLKKALGSSVVCLFLQGASGDINHIDVSGRLDTSKPDHYKTMGRILAGEALKAREKAVVADRPQAVVRQTFVPVRFRRPTERQIAEAREALQAPPGTVSAPETNFAKQILELADSDLDGAQAEIQVVTVGELAIVGLPAEIFVEFGLRIKQNSPFRHTIVNQLTNGSVSGYVCTREAYLQGGYETRLRHYSKLEEGAGDLFVEQALKLLRELKAEGGV